MNISSLTEKQKHIQDNSSDKKYNTEHHIINCIKRALGRNRLSGLKTAMRHLHNNYDKAPVVVSHLNGMSTNKGISFHWYPCQESGTLLIRNESVGLLINTTPGSKLEGIMLTTNANQPLTMANPATTLSLLLASAKAKQLPNN